TASGEPVVPVVVLQSALRLLDSHEEVAEAIVAAALYSAELSTFSRAHTELLRLLRDRSESSRIRFFVDGIETATDLSVQRVLGFARSQGLPTTLLGRSFPKLPSNEKDVRRFEVMGLVPGQEAKLLAA